MKKSTGLRDYIHVSDLASAHLDALDYLREKGRSTLLNCGCGHGFSVSEVVSSVEKAVGSKINLVTVDRRVGDPPCIAIQC